MSDDYIYRPAQGGHMDELVPVDSLLPGEPPECSKGHPTIGYDRSQCLDCERRRAWVRETVKAEGSRSPITMPEPVSLADLLAEPEEPTPYLIEGVWPLDGHVVLAAAAKAGKTTLRNNVIRSLVDGDAFLGTFAVPQTVQRVVVLDLELNRSTLRRWLRAQRIEHPERVEILPMRGQAHTLDVFTPSTRSTWAQHLNGADVVILDCLEPVLHALRLDANNEARRFLEEFGATLTEAGVPASVVLHHHGHSSERAKGDSGILAWPDALWNVVTGENDARYFSAYGRIEESIEEGRLDFDPETKHLHYVGGVRRAADEGRARAQSATTLLLHALRAEHERRIEQGDERPSDGCSVRWSSQSEVVSIGVRAGIPRDRVRAAIEALDTDELLVRSKPPRGEGSSGRKMHALTPKGLRGGDES